MTNIAVSSVAPQYSGMAAGVNGTMRQAGFVLAIAVHTIILAGVEKLGSNAASGFEHGVAALLAVASLGAIGGVYVARTRLRPPTAA